MSKKLLIALAALLLAGLGFYFFNTSSPKAENASFDTLTLKEKEEKLNEFYEGISGFGIPPKEVKFIKKSGGAATYGEIKFDSAQKLLDYFKPTEKDVFYDLGSGVGKFTLHTYLGTKVKKSCGIELSGTRYELAVKALNKAGKMGYFDPAREVIMLNEDIIDCDLSDATIIFMCATCYSDDLMNKIAKKLIEVGPGLRIATLREFKNQPRLKKIDSFKLPMTWSQGSPVHIYVVDGPKAAPTESTDSSEKK